MKLRPSLPPRRRDKDPKVPKERIQEDKAGRHDFPNLNRGNGFEQSQLENQLHVDNKFLFQFP